MMRASQGFPTRWYSHRSRMFALCCGVLLLLNACGFQLSLAPATPMVLQQTPTVEITQTPATPDLPQETPTAKPSETPASATPIPTTNNTPTPAATQACKEIMGVVVPGEFESQLLDNEPFNFQLYLPPCFDSDSGLRYPVVYLLHGLYTDETQWSLIGLPDALDTLIEETGKPFMVVMPRVKDSETQVNSPIIEVIAEELVSYIDKNYPTLPERNQRAIGGISRGASFALRIGYERWDVFGKIGMHSLPMLASESTSYAKKIGQLESDERPLLFLDSGNNDRDLFAARSFDLELTKLAIPHTWYMFNGYHDEAYWSEHLPIYLEWYAQGW